MYQSVTGIERAKTPEEVGVNSGKVYDFLSELSQKNLNIHSMMILRHGKVAVECCRYPYKPEAPMSMFSFSKGLTSTAIGIAVSEGLLTVNDKVADYFPYHCRTKRDRERHEKVTVYDLLTHRSGKFLPPFYSSEKNRWDEVWLSAPYVSEPGTKFSYISENTYMLAKILNKITGQTVEEYLTPRLFEPMDIKTPYWESDHDGCSAGGWGAFMTLEDMAKFGQCYLQMGKWNGEQLIPEEWIKLAVQPHVKKVPSVFQKNMGYGFQFFVLPERHTYSFNGLYGQFVVVFPDYDAVFACTSGCCDEYTFTNTLYKHFPDAFRDVSETHGASCLESYIYAAEHPVMQKGLRKPHLEREIDGRNIKIRGDRAYAGIIGPSTTFMLSKKAGRINDIRFHFGEESVEMTFIEAGSDEQTITAGLSDKFIYSDIKLAGEEFETAAKATWTDRGELKIRIVPLSSAQERTLSFRFFGDRVYVSAETAPGFYDLIKFYIMFNGIKLYEPISPVMKLAGNIAEIAFNPNYIGRLE